MKCVAIAIGIGAALTDALVIRTGCQFHLSVAGAISGPVGQASSGQIKSGTGISSATFTLDGSGITDSQGRGCFFTRKWTNLPLRYEEGLTNLRTSPYRDTTV